MESNKHVAPIIPDSTEKKVNKIRISTSIEGKNVEIYSENGKIKEVTVNGEKQSRSTYKKYRKLIESLSENKDEGDFSYKLIL